MLFTVNESRAAGMYKDMRTGPHHVFKIGGEKIRGKLILEGEEKKSKRTSVL